MRNRWQKQTEAASKTALGSNITELEAAAAVCTVGGGGGALATPTSVDPVLATLAVEAEYMLAPASN